MEILVVIVMISAGILPIYSLIRFGTKKNFKSRHKNTCNSFGTSAIELARTLGYDKAQRMVNDEDYQELVATAAKNGFEMEMEQVLHKVEPIPKNATEMYLLRIKITVAPKNRSAIPETAEVPTFMTILTDPRYSYY